jgi:hypothetical protein
MPKRCPDGVICFEGATFILLVCIIGLGIFILKGKQSAVSTTVSLQNPNINIPSSNELYVKPGYGYTNTSNDALLNPYAPPLVYDFGITGTRGVPINVPTQGYETSYSQVGLLTRAAGQETILPLMGRATISNRDKWAYYAISDQNNSVKLPVVRGGRSCTNDQGCDCLYNGDTVYVEGYNTAFNVTMYESGSPQYIPYL